MASIDATVERIVAWATARDGGADLAAARAAFEHATGAFGDGDAWYEERIRAFLDQWICEWRGEDGTTPIERFVRHSPDASAAEREVAGALATAERGLWSASDEEDGGLRLEDRIGGAALHLARDAECAAARLRPGDLFDGRVLLVGDTVHVAPGMIFHPREAHEAIDALLVEAASHDARTVALLDPLLRMRMRLDRFTSIRARHIYTWSAVGDEDVRSAPWAR
jgi:hypothetical protein